MGSYWTEPDEEGQGGMAEILSPGTYQGNVKRVVTARNDGSHLASKEGDLSFMAVLEDAAQTGEATCNVTLSDKGRWVLKLMLKAVGQPMADLEARNVRVEDFADQDVCDRFLTGRSLSFKVTHRKGVKDGAPVTYANALPIAEKDDPAMTPDNSPKGKALNDNCPI